MWVAYENPELWSDKIALTFQQSRRDLFDRFVGRDVRPYYALDVHSDVTWFPRGFFALCLYGQNQFLGKVSNKLLLLDDAGDVRCEMRTGREFDRHINSIA